MNQPVKAISINWPRAALEPGNPLSSLDGKPLGKHWLIVRLGPKNRVGATYFQIFLQDEGGTTLQPWVLLGLFHNGQKPSQNWIELMEFTPPVEMEENMLKELVSIIPPGGHLMVEYESLRRVDTERALLANTPPILTSLGYSLLRAGCTAGFKDWYISEGGREGPRKLQAYKPLDDKHRRTKARQLYTEVQEYLKKKCGGPASEARTQKVLEILLKEMKDKISPSSRPKIPNAG